MRRYDGEMKRSTDRILTTHAGSLPRPAALTELYAARANGQLIDEAQVTYEAEVAVNAVVSKQIEVGIDVVNNGEQPREGLRQQRFTGARWSDQQDVRLGKFGLFSVLRLFLNLDSLVVVIDCDGKLLFGLFLTNHILVQKVLDFLRHRE